MSTYKAGQTGNARIDAELARIEQALNAAQPQHHYQVRHAAPVRTQGGESVFADGSDWNPGYGAGAYLRNEANDAWLPLSHRVVSGTAVTASGAAVDFTSIPSWVKKITLSFSALSTSGTDNVIVQIGDSGGVEATGYSGASVTVVNGANPTTTAAGNFWPITGNTVTAASVLHGIVTLVLLNSATNLWAFSVVGGFSSSASTLHGGGTKALSATLDRVRLTTVNGTDTFDAGTVNILYE